MTRVEIYRVFSVIDGYTIREVSTESAAQKMCDENEEYDYEILVEYW